MKWKKNTYLIYWIILLGRSKNFPVLSPHPSISHWLNRVPVREETLPTLMRADHLIVRLPSVQKCPVVFFFLSQWILNWSYWSNNNNNIHTDLLLALVRPLKRSVNATAGKWEDFCKVWLRPVRFPARQWCQLLSQATLVANNGISSFNSLLPVREKGVEGRWRLKVDVVVHLNYRRVGTK